MSKAIQTCFKRYEKKYFLTDEQYRMFKEKTASFVKPDDYGSYTICNIYYDTDNYSLIRASLEKPVYKEKLRVRSYGVPGENGTVFVELKKKYDGVVYKRRITMKNSESQVFLKGFKTGGELSRIGREIDYFQSFWQTVPKAFIAYDREALQGTENSDLRITFDTNLRYRLDRLDLAAGDDGKRITDNDLILMEVKMPDSCPLELSKVLSELKIKPASFSKYGECYKSHIMNNNRNSDKKEMYLSA